MAIVMAAGVIASLSGQNPPPISHEYADVNGVRLHYARAGTGPLIVFVHGFPEFWYEWKNQLAEFSAITRRSAPDMRGYNLSSKPAELSAYQIPKPGRGHRALTSELMKSDRRDEVHARRPRLGGVVAWVFAALHPEMLDKLVIVNAPHPTVFAKAAARECRPAAGEPVTC